MRSVFALAVGLLVSVSTWADVVHLENGNSLEGVVTELTDSRVAIRLDFGRIVLPRSSIQRIERRSHELEEYLRRRLLLEQGEGDGAEDWLELARWARLQGLDHGATEAAKIAARLEPDLEGLPPFMRDLGYVFDDQLESWIPHEDWMRGRGFVWHRGEWLTTGDLERLARLQEAEDREKRAQERQDRLTQVMELLVLAQLEQLASESLQSTSGYAVGPYISGGYPIAWFPGYWSPPRPHPHPEHRGVESHYWAAQPAAGALHRTATHPLIGRQPGSIVPLGAPYSASHHRGSFSTPGTDPGSR